MSQQIEELNLTIPDSLDIEEQQRVLIENFSLLRDLVVTPGYLHFNRHKETSDSLTTAWTYITAFDSKSAFKKHMDIDLSTGAISIDLNGVYLGDVFVHVEGPASQEYEIAFLDSADNIISNYIFDAHDPGGHVYLHHADIMEVSEAIEDAHVAIRLTSGSTSATVRHWHVSFNRIDNYNIP